VSNPSIDNNEFAIMTGIMYGLAETLEELKRRNIDGHAFRRTGKKAKVSTVRTVVDVADVDAAEALQLVYEGLKTEVVTVVDGRLKQHDNVVVVDVMVDIMDPVTTVIGGINGPGSGYVVEATWLLQVTE